MANFRAKTRAVELLGKGQIADLPTAITELWKNGYDAYATKLECRLYLKSYKDNTDHGLFVLSDNGFGMSENDILNKWFVLGTDSKAKGEKIPPHFGLEQRIPMGEKGIGRLSVSYLGEQMLMLTKKSGETASALFIDWDVLQNRQFMLSDLEIPTFQFNDRNSLQKKLEKAKKEFRGNLDPSKWKEQENILNAIVRSLDNSRIPEFAFDEIVSDFFERKHHGTAFLIFTPHEQLLALSDKERIDIKDDASVNSLRTSLSGMHNDLKNPNTDFATSFLLLDNAGKYDIIDDFFTQNEMQSADHWLKGEFNNEGHFTGEIRIYNQRIKHTFRPTRPPGLTTYGSFEIEWGALEGTLKNSRLNDEEYRVFNEKLASFGGLYIYRDGFRVLPYGRTENDFLEFEKRRSLSAGDYFFSHRRFIGYIDISREKNENLKDKAGREGFIHNKAYRQFRDDLIDFFVDIAKRYMTFHSSANDDEKSLRQIQQENLIDKVEAQERAAKRKRKKTKTVFIQSLKEQLADVEPLEQVLKQLSDKLKEEGEKFRVNYNRYNKLLEEVNQFKEKIKELRLTRPRTVKLTKRELELYENYQKSFYASEAKFKDCIAIVDDNRKRLDAENLKLEFNNQFNNHIKQIDRRFLEYQGVVKNTTSRLRGQLREEQLIQKNGFINSTSSLAIEDFDSVENLSFKIRTLNKIAEDHLNEIDNSFGGFAKHVHNLQIDVDDEFLRDWYENKNDELSKRIEDYEELAQLGMAIEIIDHQFNVMYSQMKDSIGEIDYLSRENREIEPSVVQLKRAFQHLEGNYKLIKPLYRTSRRTREVIRGAEIEKYIKEFFANEFRRYEIDFSVDTAFRQYEFFTFDSILKPAFLNIINNANYWLIPSEKRQIRIEMKGKEILIMNSGERIDDSYLEDVFILFFTRKRDGRGIGLYLVKKNLESMGYSIKASNDDEYNKLNGACFVISKIERE